MDMGIPPSSYPRGPPSPCSVLQPHPKPQIHSGMHHLLTHADHPSLCCYVVITSLNLHKRCCRMTIASAQGIRYFDEAYLPSRWSFNLPCVAALSPGRGFNPPLLMSSRKECNTLC